ncbi:polysaccharide deacetylase family protein [Halalkalibacter oceani]|uniref:polysaccharide deacetylase family protein n=1 Tax=Halalkalibacter oceani TaxID=1653776 RepID=UPI0033925E4F
MTDQVVYDLQDDRWLTNRNQLTPTRKKVVLTFDDGPGRHLIRILDILAEREAPAMFFWLTRTFYEARPWERVIDEGHIIGSHSHKHQNLCKLTREQQYKQIKTSVKQLEAVTGETIRHFRPPFGQFNEETMDILEELSLLPVMWEISSYDWQLKEQPEKIIDNVVSHIKDGSIILLHELPQTAAVLPDIIDEVRKKGFDFIV